MLFWERVRVRSGGNAGEVAGDGEGTVGAGDDEGTAADSPSVASGGVTRQARMRRMWTLQARLEQA